MLQEANGIGEAYPPPVPAKGNGKARLLSLEDLDRRTKAFRRAVALRDELLADLGGDDRVSVAQRELAERTAVTSAMLTDLEARWLLGESVDINTYFAGQNAQRRNLQTLGMEKRPATLTTLPSFSRSPTVELERRVAEVVARCPNPATTSLPVGDSLEARFPSVWSGSPETVEARHGATSAISEALGGDHVLAAVPPAVSEAAPSPEPVAPAKVGDTFPVPRHHGHPRARRRAPAWATVGRLPERWHADELLADAGGGGSACPREDGGAEMSGATNLDGVLPKHEALIAARDDAEPSERRRVQEAVLKMLEEDRRLAYQTKQPSVALSASVAIAKVLGLFEAAEKEKSSPVEVRLQTPEGERLLARRLAWLLAKNNISLADADAAAEAALRQLNSAPVIVRLSEEDAGNL